MLSSKAEGQSFLSDSEFLSNVTPSSWEYLKTEEERKRTEQTTSPRAPSYTIAKPKEKPRQVRGLVGPGTYDPHGVYLLKSPKEAKPLLSEPKAYSAVFSKAKEKSFVEQEANRIKYSAAVGKYDVRLPEEKGRSHVNSKPIAPFSSKSKRFSSTLKPIPGPGAYEVLIPMEGDILKKRK